MATWNGPLGASSEERELSWFLILRPVGGLDEEIAGVLPVVEPVSSATFRLPGEEDLGDFASGQLLRDAAGT